jgi:hypothetical protein
MANIRLILAAVWLVLGIALLAGPWLSGDPAARPPFGESATTAGWVALLLALYNLVRWWSARSYARQRRAEQEAADRQAAQLRARRPAEPMPEPDPNFNFTETPPEREERQV